MLRPGSNNSLGRRLESAELQPATPARATHRGDISHPSRPLQRSPPREKDPELAESHGEDRKKAEVPAHRRRKPMLVMASILGFALLLGMGLIVSHRHGDALPRFGARTLSPVENAVHGAAMVEFTAPGHLLPVA